MDFTTKSNPITNAVCPTVGAISNGRCVPIAGKDFGITPPSQLGRRPFNGYNADGTFR